MFIRTSGDLNNFLIKADHRMERIPIAASVAGVAALFINCAVIPMAELLGQKDRLLRHEYFAYMHNKSMIRCSTLLVPILGQIYIARHKETSPVIVRALVRQDPALLKHASRQLLSDFHFMDGLQALGCLSVRNCQYIGHNLLSNPQFMHKIAASNLEEFINFLADRKPVEELSLIRGIWRIYKEKNPALADQLLQTLVTRRSDFASEILRRDES